MYIPHIFKHSIYYGFSYTYIPVMKVNLYSRHRKRFITINNNEIGQFQQYTAIKVIGVCSLSGNGANNWEGYLVTQSHVAYTVEDEGMIPNLSGLEQDSRRLSHVPQTSTRFKTHEFLFLCSADNVLGPLLPSGNWNYGKQRVDKRATVYPKVGGVIPSCWFEHWNLVLVFYCCLSDHPIIAQTPFILLMDSVGQELGQG